MSVTWFLSFEEYMLSFKTVFSHASLELKVAGTFVFFVLVWFLFFKRSNSLYDELERICHGDREQLESLVAYEFSRNPFQKRNEAIKRAIDRYRLDNRF